MTQGMDRACMHEDFEADVAVHRIVVEEDSDEPIAYLADIVVECRNCKEPMRWSGLQAGLSYQKPMCSIDEKTLHAPLRPASSDPDFGMGIPGYSVTWQEGASDDKA